jgi:Ser/Thr protein kinase RdoA (MazF antagonist)
MMIADEAALAATLWGGRIIRLIKHRENAVFEMALPQGRAALRLHRTGYQTEVAIRSELWWAAALADAGVAVPAPQPALSGDTLVTLAHGRHCSAIAWVDGQPMGEAGVPFTDSHATQIARHHALGALMAEVHAATAKLTLPAWFSRARWDLDGLTGDDPFWGRFWEHPSLTKAETAMLLAARDYLRGWLLALPAPDIGPIHADVLRENVLVDGTRLSLIDFDDSGIGYRLYDLGTTMSQNLYEPHYTAIRDALIAGYGRATVNEVEHFTLARTMVSVGWSAPRVPLGDPVHRRHIDRALMWSRHVLQGS